MHAFAQSRAAAGDSAEALGILSSALQILTFPEHGAINLVDPGPSDVSSSFAHKSQPHWHAADLPVARALLLRKTSEAWAQVDATCRRPAQEYPPYSTTSTTPASGSHQRSFDAARDAASYLDRAIAKLRSNLLAKFTALRSQEITCQDDANRDKGVGSRAGLSAARLDVGDDGMNDVKSSICLFATLLPLQRPQCQLLARLLVQRARLLLAFGQQFEGEHFTSQETSFSFGGNESSRTSSTLPRARAQARAARVIAGACRIAFCAAYGAVPTRISVGLKKKKKSSSFADASQSPLETSAAGPAASRVSDSFQNESSLLEPPLGLDELFSTGQACAAAASGGAADVLSHSGGGGSDTTLPAILLEAGGANCMRNRDQVEHWCIDANGCCGCASSPY